MSKFKIVITDREFLTIEEETKVFSDQNFELIDCQCKNEEEVIEATKDADAIINQYAPVTRKVIENMKNCKVITRYGVGVDTIDVEAATDNNIIVANVTDYCIDEVSNHAIALLMALNRKVNLLDRSTKKGEWTYNHVKPIYRLKGLTLGILGFGAIAKEVARKAQVFDFNIIAFDPYISKKTAEEYNVKLVDFDTVFEESDYISLHMPLNQNTKHIVGAEAFKKAKSNLNIINTGRGGLIDEDALIEALTKNRIAGAGLDVVENTPIKSPLDKMDNVIITPHVAYYSESSLRDLQRIAAEQCYMVLKGFYPKNFFNKEIKDNLDLKEE